MGFDGSITDGVKYLQTEIDDKSQWVEEREHVWNWVWWRRVTYFGTLFTTLALVAMPLLKPALPKGACSSKVCFVSDVIDSVAAAVLPGFTATWTDSFSSHPDVFLVLAALIMLGLWGGGIFERYVRDAMRPIWYGIPKTSPRTVSPPPPPAKINRAVQWLRTRKPYQWSLWFLTQRLLPGAFLVAVGYAAIAFVSQVTFAVQDSWGQVCASAGKPKLKPVPSREEGEPFGTNALCTSTGLTVEKGATYRLHITIPAGDPWTDSGHPAGPNGVPPKELSPPMTIGVLLRRHLGQPWLKPMAKIGVIGRDEYPLDPVPSLALDKFPTKSPSKSPIDRCPNAPVNVPNRSPEDTTFATEIVARSSGELFLYLNDAIFLPPKTELFYCNNEGSGRVTVERVVPPPL